jgi:hypothetical protein
MSITRYLLASDLDGTLIPLERDAQRLREVEELVRALAASEDLRLAYVTGRHLALAQAGPPRIGSSAMSARVSIEGRTEATSPTRSIDRR